MKTTFPTYYMFSITPQMALVWLHNIHGPEPFPIPTGILETYLVCELDAVTGVGTSIMLRKAACLN